MIVNFSPKAITGAKQFAKAENQQLQPYIESMLEKIFNGDSGVMLLNPIPSESKLKAIHAFINLVMNQTDEEKVRAVASFVEGIANNEDFVGFKFINRAEANEAFKEAFTVTVPEDVKETSETKVMCDEK